MLPGNTILPLANAASGTPLIIVQATEAVAILSMIRPEMVVCIARSSRAAAFGRYTCSYNSPRNALGDLLPKLVINFDHAQYRFRGDVNRLCNFNDRNTFVSERVFIHLPANFSQRDLIQFVNDDV